MTEDSVDISIIIPAYNEAQNYSSGQLEQVYRFMRSQSWSFEIILANDGSTDNTLDLLKSFAQDKVEVTVLDLPHRGKGPTVSAAMLKARGLNRLFTDFDQSTPIGELLSLLQYRKQGYDIVVGSREIEGARRDDEPWYRHLMGRGFNYIVQLLTIRGIRDTQCGFKLFSDKATTQLFPLLYVYGGDHLRQDAFTGAFDVELLYLAQKNHYSVAEVPVQWKHVPTERVNPIKDSVRMFKDVVYIRLADLQGKYKQANT